MDRKLCEMSLEELWRLFPIELVEHRPVWRQWAAEEIDCLERLLGDIRVTITHIGSTAIPGIMAKPIVDILVLIPPEVDMAALKCRMESHGYICMNESPTRMSFNKGYTPEGYAEKVFHIHCHRYGDDSEIKFRDYLLSYAEAASEYESLKMSLLPEYKYDRDGYTAAKSVFVDRILRLAKSEI
ncbi:MAG: GrpB family protein [Paramuribaculum sp.]|nr:GrpB family protein [Paramuribaculum sp.]